MIVRSASRICGPVVTLAEREAPRGTLELTLPPADLRRIFTDIKDGLFVIEDLDPEQGLVVAGACERVLGVVGIGGEAR